MQNLKIQTLWQLCQELKQKRQDLIEKLSYTQTYLDKQQSQISSELFSLRQQNSELSSDLAQLTSHLETLRQSWDRRGEDGNGAGDSQSAMLQLELDTLRGQYQELQAAYDELQASQAEAAPGDLDQVESLGENYAKLNAELSEVKEALETKETQLGVLLQTVQVIQREFEALRQSNNELSGDIVGLSQQTDQIIGLVETYRQVALAAATEAGMQEEAEATVVGDEDEEGGKEDDGVTKAEAVREAVRKKINTLLRHRFGKVPRKLSSSIKEVSSNNRLDKLFDKALKAETLDEFEASIEA